jgi:hypothetical protein
MSRSKIYEQNMLLQLLFYCSERIKDYFFVNHDLPESLLGSGRERKSSGNEGWFMSRGKNLKNS